MNKKNKLFLRLCCLGLTLLLVACRSEAPTTPTPTLTVAPLETATAELPTATPDPTATPVLFETTILLSPQPQVVRQALSPLLEVGDQQLDDAGALMVSRVVSSVPGWVVVTTAAGDVLGQTAVPEGESTDVVVTIDPLAARPTLIVGLYADLGQTAVWEGAAVDGLLSVAGKRVEALVDVTVTATLPQISVGDQDITSNYRVVISDVVALTPGWVVVYADQDGGTADLLGFARVPAGESRDLAISVAWQKVTGVMHVMLLQDGGEIGRFEPSVDHPVTIQQRPLLATFAALLPPDLVVYDQPVISNTVEIERVTSNGPGWIAIYFDGGSALGNVIGYAYLEPGVNEQVRVTVVARLVTPVLYIRLHEDSGEAQIFDFPGGDPAITYEKRVPGYTFRTDTGSFLVSQDQSLGADGVRVPIVTVEADSWVVVRATTADSLPGPILGQSWVPAGFNRDVYVTIDATQATDQLSVALYSDGGVLKEFEPEVDLPLVRGRTPVSTPFNLRR